MTFLGVGAFTLVAMSVGGIENEELIYLPIGLTVLCICFTIYQCVRAIQFCQKGSKGIVRILISILLIIFPIYACFSSLAPLFSKSETETAGISEELNQIFYDDNAVAFSQYLDGKHENDAELLKSLICYNAANCLTTFASSEANIPQELDGKTVLQYSIDNNSEAGVNFAVQSLGMAVDTDILRNAVQEGKTAAAYAIIRNGVAPTDIDAEGYTLLHKLAVADSNSRNYASIYRLKNKAKEAQNLQALKRYEEALSYDTLFVDAVVAAGVDVNAKTIYGRTAADFVFGMEKTDTAATALKDYDGKNGGASNLLYALMKNGANVNLEYALNMAVAAVDPDLLSVICERGYDINQLEAAQIIGSFYQPDMDYFLPTLKEVGFDFSARNGAILLRNLCCNAVTYKNAGAVGSGLWTEDDFISAIEYTIDEGADANWQSTDGESTIYRVHMAAIGYKTESDVEYAMKIMHILVDAGADINPLQDGKYMMTYLESYKDAATVKAYRKEFGLN